MYCLFIERKIMTSSYHAVTEASEKNNNRGCMKAKLKGENLLR